MRLVLGQNKSNSNNELVYFHSKLLLFGEYSIIKDSMALATPYHLFKGALRFPNSSEQNRGSDQELQSFLHYLKDLMIQEEKHLFNFDISSFEFDLSQGLFFDSTIPLGFGIGSSGALCAAIFDRYGEMKINVEKTENLYNFKQVFSLMESHFHGSSSGIDPLISFMDHSILIKEKGDLELVTLPDYSEGDGAVFLINTGRPRRTEPLVNLFLEKCKNDEFSTKCSDVLLPITNLCIESFLNKRINELINSFRILSSFQYENFKPMIPKLYQPLWKKGLDQKLYSMKLCGAGGGGFLLGITSDFKKAYPDFDNYQVKKLFSF